MTDAVHNRIGLLRAERGVSRRELADALGVHYQTIGYLAVSYTHLTLPTIYSV